MKNISDADKYWRDQIRFLAIVLAVIGILAYGSVHCLYSDACLDFMFNMHP